MALTFYDLVDKDGRRYSPYGWRVRMALAHKGLDAAVELCWHSDKEKLSFSGQHLVPVLRDGERAVSDSWTIACYLDEAYPDRDRLMDGAQGRAFAKFLNSWTDTIVGRPLVRSLYLDICSHCIQAPTRANFAGGARSATAQRSRRCTPTGPRTSTKSTAR